ncbi:phosphoribosylglycinamide formyltransferase [Alkanindiges sp. WGS2144]|uniref:phosphoribosylglycinamide formyltransferase n=1 Tax=Alkanindiges sp. WGS2144 TaxID=3366808 RepID=UPI0037514E34
MIKFAVLASGNGSNLQAMIDAVQKGRIQAELMGVISNVPDAYALQRAKNAGIRQLVIDHRQFADREAFEAEVIQALQSWQVDMIVLAGFMRVLSANFVNRFSGQLINIHPSLLPAYKGLHTHQRVLNTGDKFHGCTVHFVTPELDSGAAIAQSVLQVNSHDTVESLKARVHVLEHQLYPKIMGWIAAGRVALLGKKAYLDGQLLQEPVRFFDH